MFHSWNQACRIIGFLEWCPHINHARCWEQCEGWTSDHITYFQASDGQVLWSSHHLFHLLVQFSVNRGSAIAALPRILDLWSACQTVFVETVFKINIEFCCHLLWFIDTILFNVWWSLSLSFGFRQLFLLADHVLPWSVYVIITLETAALDTPNKVALFGYRCSS